MTTQFVYDAAIEKLKPWAQVIQEREIRECVRCTSMIANHRAYGRPPRTDDPTLCECCEGPAPDTCLHCGGKFLVGDNAQRVGPYYSDGTPSDFLHFRCYVDWSNEK